MNDALQQYGHCLLPDVGLLFIIRNPSSRSYQDNKIHPPVYEISLIPLSGKDDKFYSIIQQIAFSHSLPEEEAALKWSEAASAIREKLSTGSSVELPGIGLLNLDNDRRITLDEERSPISVYGPVSLDEIKSFSIPKAESTTEASPSKDSPQMEEQPEKDISPTIHKRNKRRREMASWWIAATIIALLVVGWLTYKGTIKRNEKVAVIKSIIAKDTTKYLAKSDSLNLSKDSVLQENSMRRPDSIHYTIIFGVYDNKEKAMHQYHKMKDWGHPVVLLAKGVSTYELGMPFITLPSDTTVSLVSMMKLYGDKVHIEYDSAVSK
jgi:hypothetical protein